MIRTLVRVPAALALGFAAITVGAQTPGCTYDPCALRLISGPGSTGVVQGAEATPRVGLGALLAAAVAFVTIKGKARDRVAGGFS